MSIRPFIRDIQSRFGYMVDFKTSLQRIVLNARNIPFEAEYKILNFLTPKGRCAIDVGANRGQSIDAIRLYHSNAHIYSFEPNKTLFDKLSKWFSSDKNLVLKNFGLGNSEFSTPLFVPYYRNYLYDGLSSFSKDRASTWLNTETVWHFNPQLLRIEQHTCSVKMLDTFSFVPFFLKIHVQGYEYDVIKGGIKTIRKHQPVLLIANNEQADHWLRQDGWAQYVMTDGCWIRLEKNDLSFYNCVYFNIRNEEHNQIVSSLKIG